MTWEKYLGLPFSDHSTNGGVDCFGLVRLILRDECGLELPTYGEGYRSCRDWQGISDSIRKGLSANFDRVDDPRMFDLIVFNIRGKPLHVGMVIGPTQFIHANEPDERGKGGESRIERFTDSMWNKRIEGFYRYVG